MDAAGDHPAVYGGRAAGDSGEPKDLRFKPLIRTIFILPWAVPGFVTILVFAGMFNDSFGVINNAILSFWHQSEGMAHRSVLDQNGADHDADRLGFPFVFAMTTGVLQAIPDDLYEAATMDGASAFTRLRTITLPLVLYAIAPIIITQYTFNFNNFNIIYLFNNGGPAVAGSNAGGTDILVSWIYKLTMSSSQYAIAATITILLSIFVVGPALWQFRATKSFKMTTWRKGSNMAQSPSIKREKWIRLSLTAGGYSGLSGDYLSAGLDGRGVAERRQ